MTGSLVVPLDVRPPPAVEPGRRAWWLGVAALALASFGLIVWVVGYSPRSFNRFEGTAADRVVEFPQAGEYVVYEEFPGASEPGLPSPMTVEVVAVRRGSAEVHPLQEPGEVAAPGGYDLFGREGRAMARFEVHEAGTYRVVVQPRLGGEPGDFGRFQPVTFAVAPAATLGWMGAWWAPLVLCGIPLVVGVAALVVAAVARRSAPRVNR